MRAQQERPVHPRAQQLQWRHAYSACGTGSDVASLVHQHASALLDALRQSFSCLRCVEGVVRRSWQVVGQFNRIQHRIQYVHEDIASVHSVVSFSSAISCPRSHA